MKRLIFAIIVGVTLSSCSGSADKQSTQPATEPTEQSADDDIYEIGYEEASDTVQSASFETDETPDATEKPSTTVHSAAEEKIRKEIQKAGGKKRKLIEKEIKPMER